MPADRQQGSGRDARIAYPGVLLILQFKLACRRITDRGTPVLKIVPFEEQDAPDLAAVRGTLLRHEEPLEPVHEPWKAAA